MKALFLTIAILFSSFEADSVTLIRPLMNSGQSIIDRYTDCVVVDYQGYIEATCDNVSTTTQVISVSQVEAEIGFYVTNGKTGYSDVCRLIIEHQSKVGTHRVIDCRPLIDPQPLL